MRNFLAKLKPLLYGQQATLIAILTLGLQIFELVAPFAIIAGLVLIHYGVNPGSVFGFGVVYGIGQIVTLVIIGMRLGKHHSCLWILTLIEIFAFPAFIWEAVGHRPDFAFAIRLGVAVVVLSLSKPALSSLWCNRLSQRLKRGEGAANPKREWKNALISGWGFIWRFTALSIFFEVIVLTVLSFSSVFEGDPHYLEGLPMVALACYVFVELVATWLSLLTLANGVLKDEFLSLPVLVKNNNEGPPKHFYRTLFRFSWRSFFALLVPYSLGIYIESTNHNGVGLAWCVVVHFLAPFLIFRTFFFEEQMSNGGGEQAFHSFLPEKRVSQTKAVSSNEFVKGNERNFNNRLFEDPNFKDVELEDFTFVNSEFPLNADFSGATLDYVDFTNCQLEGCDFQGVTASDISFRHADLRGAKLEQLKGARVTDFGGSDLTNAEVGDTLDFSEIISPIAETSKAASNLHMLFVGACIYSWITALNALGNSEQLVNRSVLKLPVTNSEISSFGFFVLGPTVLLGMFTYFQLYLHRLWQQLSKIPAIFPDGATLTSKVYPWILSAPAEIHAPRLQEQNSGPTYIALWATITSAWVIMPLTCIVFWVGYLFHHSWLGTLYHVALIGISSFIALYFYEKSVQELTGKNLYSQHENIRLTSAAAFSFGLSLVFGMLSFFVHEGNRISIPILYADLDNMNVSKPVKDAGVSVAKAEVPRYVGVKLTGIGLHGASAKKTVLNESELQSANMSFSHCEEAELKRCDLTDAECPFCRFEGAHFDGATVGGLNLSHSVLNGAYFNDAQCISMGPGIFTGNSFADAILSLRPTDFCHTTLDDVNFSNAFLCKAKFHDLETPKMLNFENSLLVYCSFNQPTALSLANLSFADVYGSQFSKNTNFQSATIKDTVFCKTRLCGANFSGKSIERVGFFDLSQIDKNQLIHAKLKYNNVRILSALSAVDDKKKQSRHGDCNLIGGDTSPKSPDRVDISGACDLSDADFSKTILRHVSFQGSDLRRAKFNEATLDDVDFTDCLLDGADFTDCHKVGKVEVKDQQLTAVRNGETLTKVVPPNGVKIPVIGIETQGDSTPSQNWDRTTLDRGDWEKPVRTGNAYRFKNKTISDLSFDIAIPNELIGREEKDVKAELKHVYPATSKQPMVLLLECHLTDKKTRTTYLRAKFFVLPSKRVLPDTLPLPTEYKNEKGAITAVDSYPQYVRWTETSMSYIDPTSFEGERTVEYGQIYPKDLTPPKEKDKGFAKK